MAVLYYESQIAHHGIKGQKWGVRRFQNYNGRLTRAGKSRYSISDESRNWDSKRYMKTKRSLAIVTDQKTNRNKLGVYKYDVYTKRGSKHIENALANASKHMHDYDGLLEEAKGAINEYNRTKSKESLDKSVKATRAYVEAITSAYGDLTIDGIPISKKSHYRSMTNFLMEDLAMKELSNNASYDAE